MFDRVTDCKFQFNLSKIEVIITRMRDNKSHWRLLECKVEGSTVLL